jgi:hypothetical protein
MEQDLQSSGPMTSIPGLSSNDPVLLEAVSSWLNESRMPLPAGLDLRLEVVDIVPEYEDSREIFPQGDVQIRAGEPLGWVHLTWRIAPAVARIDAERPQALLYLSRESLGRLDYLLRSFILVTLIFLWKRDGRYHVHAGTGVDAKGRGWMLIGNSCSGKSTTTALLASRGWRISTDDIAFLTDSDGRAGVLGFRSPIALRSGGFQLLGKEGGVPLVARQKTGFWPEELGATCVQTVVPEIVVFTSVGGDRTTLTPAQPGEVLKALLQWSLWVMFEPTAAQEHLDLLSRLGRQARCYHATLAPDLFAAPGAIEDFLP